MSLATGLDMNSAMLFQLIRETTPGVYNLLGVRSLMTSLRVEEQPETAFDKFKPGGFNDVAWTAMTREHRILSGPVRLDYAQIDTLLEMMFGAAVSDDIATGIQTTVYELPIVGAVSRQTYTAEYGLRLKASRMVFTLLQSLSLNFMRAADNSEGSVTIITRTPSAEDVEMTGLGLAQGEVQQIVVTNAKASQQFAFKRVGEGTLSATWTVADSNGTLDTRLEELYGAGTVSISGSLTTSTVDPVTGETRYSGTLTLTFAAEVNVPQVEIITGESNRILVASGDGGNYVYDGRTFTLGQSAATIQSTFRGGGGSLAAVNVKGTTTAPSSSSLKSFITAAERNGGGGGATLETTTYDGNYTTGTLFTDRGEVQYDFGVGVTKTLLAVEVWLDVQDVTLVNIYSQAAGFGTAEVLVQAFNGLTSADWVAANGKFKATLTLSVPLTTRGFVVDVWTGVSGSLNVVEVNPVGAGVVGSAALDVHYPPALGNIALPSVTGTGITRSTTEAGAANAAAFVVTTTQQGSSGTITVPAFVPILPQQWTTRRATAYADLEDADPIEKVSGFTLDAPDQVVPLWHQAENVVTWGDHVDGENELRVTLTVANDTDGEVAAILAEARAVPSTPNWWQWRATHPDGDHTLRIEMYAAVGENLGYAVENNVRYRTVPLIAHLNGEGVRMRVTMTKPA